jgi:tRNA(Ile2) C34 agmatinyltransferase TiaS
MIPSAALLPATKPVCHRCRLFIVERDGQVCEVCRLRMAKDRMRKYQRDLAASKRMAQR